MPTDDPPLNARGRQRAELLADFLQDIDVVAGVNAIYASDKRRTQETAAPLAKRLNLPVEIADHHDIDGFMADVLDDHRRRHRADRVALRHDCAVDRRAARQQALAAVRAPTTSTRSTSSRFRGTARSRRCGLHYGEPPRGSSSSPTSAAKLSAAARSRARYAAHVEQRIRRHHSVGRELRVLAAELHGSARRSRDNTTRTTYARARHGASRQAS